MSTKVKYLFEQKELNKMSCEKLKTFKVKYLNILAANPFPKPQGDGGCI